MVKRPVWSVNPNEPKKLQGPILVKFLWAYKWLESILNRRLGMNSHFCAVQALVLGPFLASVPSGHDSLAFVSGSG